MEFDGSNEAWKQHYTQPELPSMEREVVQFTASEIYIRQSIKREINSMVTRMGHIIMNGWLDKEDIVKILRENGL